MPSPFFYGKNMHIELNLEELTESSVAEKLRKEHQTSLETERSRLENLNKRLSNTAAKALKIKEKLKGSQDKIEILRTRLEKRRQALLKTQRDVSVALSKERIMDEEEMRLINEIRSNQKDLIDCSARVESTKDLLELTDSSAKSLMTVSSLLLPGTSIEICDEVHRAANLIEMSWKTREIFINDEDGQPLPLNFGSFEISASVSTGKSLTVKMHALNPEPRRSYAHPHVSSDGSPCLGNANPMILQSLLANNYGMVIKVVDKFLTHYNKQDPYIPLSHWVPSMYHTPMCECGLRLITACTCTRCNICLSLMTDSTESHLYPFQVRRSSQHGCGSCSVCCSAHHLQRQEDDLKETGINGSPCYTAAIFKPDSVTS